MSVLATALAEGGHEIVNELPMQPEVYGVIAMGVFVALLAVTFAFKSVASRHGDQPTGPQTKR